jgi:RsiW-degrading membrane proteinase PrsW (M82 family)
MGLFLSLLFGFLPMLLYAWVIFSLDRFEKEPGRLLGGVFLWGAIVAAGGAFLMNTLLGMSVLAFTGSETATDLATGSLIAPVVEESLKAFAILVVFLFFRNEFDSYLDGIVYAGIVALGFAATENTYYIYRYGFSENGLAGLAWLVFVRVILVGWQHPFYTAFIGLGLAGARLTRQPVFKVAALLLGWSAAVLAHSLHNTFSDLLPSAGGLMLGTLLDWTGWAAMGLVILWAIRREGRYLTLHLQEELGLGLISPAQYRTACSAWYQGLARLSALPSGNYPATSRFYQVCAELAHKKEQYHGLGDEDGNAVIILRLRDELARLSPLARSYPLPDLVQDRSNP